MDEVTTGPNVARSHSHIVVVLIAGISMLGGVSIASNLVSASQPAPAGTAATPGGTPTPAVDPVYPTNQSGQTYGMAADNVDPGDWPDLISVQATNGNLGYVDRELLAEVTGANVATPAEAVEWTKQMNAATWDTIELEVYEADGHTRIGLFPISRSQPTDDY